MKAIWSPPPPPGPEVTVISVVGRTFRRGDTHPVLGVLWLRYDDSEWTWGHLLSLAADNDTSIFDISDKRIWD